MFKYILLILGVVTVAVILNLNAVQTAKVTPPPPPPYIAECKKSENATDNDVQTLKRSVLPNGHIEKCLITCYAEKTGELVNNKLDTDKLLNWAKQSPLYEFDGEVEKNVNATLEECSAISDPNRCEYGSRVMFCIKYWSLQRKIANIFTPPK